MPEWEGEAIAEWNDETICPKDGAPNHAIFAVGYYVDPNNERNIWINFKNSWGTQWGNNGYFKLTLNNDLSTYGHGPCKML